MARLMAGLTLVIANKNYSSWSLRAWLFGSFSIADAMYAPVVLRFRAYGVGLEGNVAAYAHTVLSDAAMNEWLAAARAETEIVPSDEAGTPV